MDAEEFMVCVRPYKHSKLFLSEIRASREYFWLNFMTYKQRSLQRTVTKLFYTVKVHPSPQEYVKLMYV